MAIKYIFRATVLKVEERFHSDVSTGWWVTLSGSPRSAQFFGMTPIDLREGDIVEETIMKRPADETASQIVIEPKPPVAPAHAPFAVEARVAVEARAAAFAMAGAPPKELLLADARAQGYEGDACNDCGHFTLVRNGTCLKCNTCGATTGCS